jgi:hypothetical protein
MTSRKTSTEVVRDFRYRKLLKTAEKAKDALDSIQDEAADVSKPLTLPQVRKLAKRAFYPLAEALDAIRDAEKKKC